MTVPNMAIAVITSPKSMFVHIAANSVWYPTLKKKKGTKNPNASVCMEWVNSALSQGLWPGSLSSTCLIISPLNNAPMYAPIPKYSASVAINSAIIIAAVKNSDLPPLFGIIRRRKGIMRNLKKSITAENIIIPIMS